VELKKSLWTPTVAVLQPCELPLSESPRSISWGQFWENPLGATLFTRPWGCINQPALVPGKRCMPMECRSR
jgi:hypothetical protein